MEEKIHISGKDAESRAILVTLCGLHNLPCECEPETKKITAPTLLKMIEDNAHVEFELHEEIFALFNMNPFLQQNLEGDTAKDVSSVDIMKSLTEVFTKNMNTILKFDRDPSTFQDWHDKTFATDAAVKQSIAELKASGKPENMMQAEELKDKWSYILTAANQVIETYIAEREILKLSQTPTPTTATLQALQMAIDSVKHSREQLENIANSPKISEALCKAIESYSEQLVKKEAIWQQVLDANPLAKESQYANLPKQQNSGYTSLPKSAFRNKMKANYVPVNTVQAKPHSEYAQIKKPQANQYQAYGYQEAKPQVQYEALPAEDAEYIELSLMDEKIKAEKENEYATLVISSPEKQYIELAAEDGDDDLDNVQVFQYQEVPEGKEAAPADEDPRTVEERMREKVTDVRKKYGKKEDDEVQVKSHMPKNSGGSSDQS